MSLLSVHRYNASTVYCVLYRASDLDHIVYRMGLLAVLRSKCKKGKCVVRIISG